MLRMPILDSYVLSEMIGPFLFFFAAFFLFWALNIFFLAADYIVNQHAPIVLVAKFVVFRMPQAIPMAFPFASLLAALLAMGRLMADTEITAMRTSGIPILRIARAPLIFGAAMFVICWTMNEYVATRSVDISTRSFYQIIYHTDALPIEQNLFRRDASTGTIYYVTQFAPDAKTAQDVQIYEPAHGSSLSETLQAKDASIDGNVLVLHDAVDTSYDASGYLVQQKHVDGVRVALPLGETIGDFVSTTTNDPWTMNSKALSAEVNALKAQGIGGTALGSLEINLADKLAWPFASLVGIVVAIPLALRFGKRGKMLGVGLGILAFFAYYLLTSAMSAFGRTGAMDPYVAAWIPNVLMVVAGTVLFWLEER
jgi:LPS export ABC transporter permease LptG